MTPPIRPPRDLGLPISAAGHNWHWIWLPGAPRAWSELRRAQAWAARVYRCRGRRRIRRRFIDRAAGWVDAAAAAWARVQRSRSED